MEKNLIRKRQLYDYKEVEKILKLGKQLGLKFLYYGIGEKYKSQKTIMRSKEYSSLTNNILIGIKDTKLEITTKYYRYKELVKKGFAPCTWIFDLNDDPEDIIGGQQTFMEQQKAYKINKIKDDEKLFNMLKRFYDKETGKYVCSASPIIDYNSDYEDSEVNDCYEYDINSAYSDIIIHQIPDTTAYWTDRRLKKNEIGFLIDDQLTLVEGEGKYAQIIFKIIDSPKGLIDYHTKYYETKKYLSDQIKTIKNKVLLTAEDKALLKELKRNKDSCKKHLNLPIGYCQRYNPFIRSYVVHKCNERIRKLIDKDTLFWNTDAIFSKVRRTDLELGDNIGQFKEEHIDRLAYIGNNYQINYDIPTYRGVPKQWFKQFEIDNGRPWDIRKDTLPKRDNIYEFDKDHNKVILKHKEK